MTNKEIISSLRGLIGKYNISDDEWQTVEQAINVLSNSDEDCISREQAIRIAEQGQLLGYEWQFKELCKLPSIQPKAKMGHWIYRVVGIYRYASCSECNKMQVDESDYCPNCGAKMEGK